MMKPSNRILALFFGFAFLYLTAVFAEVRLRGTPNIINDSNSIAESADIRGVAHVVLKNLEHSVAVTASDQPRLEVRSLSGNMLSKATYRISGDTLMLSGLPSDGRTWVRVTVFLPRSGLKSILVDSAVATMKGLDQKSLNVLQNAGRIFMQDNKIGSLHLTATGKSHLNMTATSVDTLSVTLNNSEVAISSPVTLLQGTMEDHSFLRAGAIGEIRFKTDGTSRMNLYSKSL